MAPLAYSDIGRPTLLSPLVLARLIQAAGVTPADTVLDVAPATGYSPALLAGLAEAASAKVLLSTSA